MVDVITRGEPAHMVAHWTGMYWNGQERGFKIFQEVVRRLKARFDNLLWMKLSEVSRYWAAKELTRVKRSGNRIELNAPFATPWFTLRVEIVADKPPRLRMGDLESPLKEATSANRLSSGSWIRDGQATILCFDLPKGASSVEL